MHWLQTSESATLILINSYYYTQCGAGQVLNSHYVSTRAIFSYRSCARIGCDVTYPFSRSPQSCRIIVLMGTWTRSAISTSESSGFALRASQTHKCMYMLGSTGLVATGYMALLCVFRCLSALILGASKRLICRIVKLSLFSSGICKVSKVNQKCW